MNSVETENYASSMALDLSEKVKRTMNLSNIGQVQRFSRYISISGYRSIRPEEVDRPFTNTEMNPENLRFRSRKKSLRILNVIFFY